MSFEMVILKSFFPISKVFKTSSKTLNPTVNLKATLDDRLDRSYKTRDSRKLTPLPKPEKPSLFKTSVLMFILLAGISAIFVAIVHYIPGAQLILIIPAILLAFAIVIIPILRITGIITDTTFSKSLEGFFNALPVLNGKDLEPQKEPTEKTLPEDPKE